MSSRPNSHPGGLQTTILFLFLKFNTSLTNSFDKQTILSPEAQEVSSHQPLSQEESLEPPKKRASMSPGKILEKELEVAQLQDQVGSRTIVLDAEPFSMFLLSVYNSEPFSTNPPLPGSSFIPTRASLCAISSRKTSQTAFPP